MPRPALGLVETSGIEGAIKATRAASEAGQVVIVSAEQGALGRMTVKIEGEWSAVQGAVEAGARAAYLAGELVSMHVIPKSDDEVSAIMPYPRFVGRYTPDETSAPIPKKPAVEKARPARVASAAKPAKKPAASQTPVVAVPPKAPAPAISEPTRIATASVRIPAPSAPVLSEAPTWEQLEAMAVVKLRRYARGVPGLPIQGRQISIANKEQLLAALATMRPSEKP